MNIAFKCVKCDNFFGKIDIDDRSFVILHNKPRGHVYTFDICDRCWEGMYGSLIELFKKPVLIEVVKKEPEQGILF